VNFTAFARVVAYLVVFFGFAAIAFAFYIDGAFGDDRAAMIEVFGGVISSQKTMWQGFLVIFAGLAMGVATDISMSLKEMTGHLRRPGAEDS